MQLASELRAEPGPVLLEHAAEVIGLPVFGRATVDYAGRGVPEGDRPAVSAARAIRRVPGAPLLPRHRPRISQAQDVLQPALVPHRVADLARDLARGGTLE